MKFRALFVLLSLLLAMSVVAMADDGQRTLLFGVTTGFSVAYFSDTFDYNSYLCYNTNLTCLHDVVFTLGFFSENTVCYDLSWTIRYDRLLLDPSRIMYMSLITHTTIYPTVTGFNYGFGIGGFYVHHDPFDQPDGIFGLSVSAYISFDFHTNSKGMLGQLRLENTFNLGIFDARLPYFDTISLQWVHYLVF